MPIKSFRGLIDDDGQHIVHLHTNNGSTGYRITKFQIMPQRPGGSDHRFVLKIYKIEQADNIRAGTNLFSIVDFSDQTLIGAATYFSEVSGSPAYIIGSNTDVVFDNEVFNQDIYIVHENFHGDNAAINYYIELEQIKLDLNNTYNVGALLA